MADRVTVFMDYQDVHGRARSRFLPYGADRADGHVHPLQVGELLVSRRNRVSELQEVRVYRGRPNPDKQPGATRANDRQTSDWERSPRVKVIRRNVQYPPNWPTAPAVEKGIDVAIAVDMIELCMSDQMDVAILFSSDKDLLPAVEMIARHRRCHVEVACWAGSNRLRIGSTQKPWCHHLSEADFDSVRDRFDYSLPG
jgi:uncharacterized LabA/DUF88 family protein